MTIEKRFWKKVNKTDGCWLWTACIVKNPSRKEGYGMFRAEEKNVFAHRYAYELLVGPIPEGMQLDHRITCSKHCVNPQHLRLATNKQNSENRGALSSNTSGVAGVSWQKDHKRWRAQVKHHGKRIHVGYFANLTEAETAVIAKRNELFTHNDLDRLRT